MTLILFCVYARRIQQMLFHIQKQRGSIVSWFIFRVGVWRCLSFDGRRTNLTPSSFSLYYNIRRKNCNL